MNFSVLFFLLCLGYSYAVTGDDIQAFLDVTWKVLNEIRDNALLPADTGLNITQLLTKYGYPVEEHTVTTEDGYILGMFRIPSQKVKGTGTSEETTYPVLLMHGLFSSATDYCNNGQNGSLAMLLADEGYDVWMGNTRGNMFSRKHKTLDPDTNSSFWDFSFNEKGIYDLPAMIDYILVQTQASKVSYVGHSEGTTDFFVMGSEKPEYNDKIAVMAALAPIAFVQNLSSPFVKYLVENMDLIEIAVDLLNIHEFPPTPWISLIADVLCNDDSGLQPICVDLISLIVGFDPIEFNKTNLPVIASNAPAGASVRQLVHFGQEIRSGHFGKYDYGVENVIYYGQMSPPLYNISQVTAPVALYYGQNDFLAAISNVDQLLNQLPNVADSYIVNFQYFNHLDFLWSIDINTLVYNRVIDMISKHSVINIST